MTTIAGWQFKAIAKANIPGDRRPRDVLRHRSTCVAGLDRAGAAGALHQPHPAVGRHRRDAVHRAGGDVGELARAAGVRIAGGGRRRSRRAIRCCATRSTRRRSSCSICPVPCQSDVPGQVVHRHRRLPHGRCDSAALAILLFAAVLGLTRADDLGDPGRAWRVVLGGVGGAAAIRREPAREHSSAPRRHRARGGAGASSGRPPICSSSRSRPARPSEILYALNLFGSVARPRGAPGGPRTGAARIARSARAGGPAAGPRRARRDLTAEIERLLYDPHLEVRTEALLYLTQHAHVDPLERIEQLGEFPDFSLRAAMAAFLARPGRAQNVDAARAIVSAMVNETGDAGRRTRIEAAELHRLRAGPVRRRPAACCSTTAIPRSSAAAIRAVGRLRKRSLIPRVIKRLAQPELTDVAVAVFAGNGRHRVRARCAIYLVDPDTPIEVRREIPRCCRRSARPPRSSCCSKACSTATPSCATA